MPEAIKLDDFLKRQKETNKVTIEPVEGDEKLIKVTPWSKSGGCSCSRSIKVPKDAVKSVLPTGEEHLCCGKMLLVATVEFKDEHSLKLSDVLNQLSHNESEHHHKQPAAQANFQMPGPMVSGLSAPNQPFNNGPAFTFPCGVDGLRCAYNGSCNPPWGCYDQRGLFRRCGSC